MIRENEKNSGLHGTIYKRREREGQIVMYTCIYIHKGASIERSREKGPQGLKREHEFVDEIEKLKCKIEMILKFTRNEVEMRVKC